MSDNLPELTRAIEDYELRVSPDLKTVSGRLKYGVVMEGTLRHEFSMHLLTVREDMVIDPLLAGQERMLAVYTLSLDTLGGVPNTQLSADFLADNLAAADFDALFFAQELLAKNRLCPHPPATDTATPS